MVNSVFGKTIENLTDRDVVRICSTKEELMHAVSKSTYKRQIIVNEELVVVLLNKIVVYYDKPYYIGFSILDISKFIMYDYFYNILKRYFRPPASIDLLYSDTDSFILKIKTNDIYHDLKCLSTSFDFSNLPRNNPLFDESKKLKLFNFKEEFGLLPILRIVSLGSKVYSLQVACCHSFGKENEGECKLHTKQNTMCIKKTNSFVDKLILKGISSIAKSQFSFDDYFLCLKNQRAQRVLDSRIESKSHKLSSVIVRKIALSGFCDKRYILDCGIHSMPYSYTNSPECNEPECIVREKI